MAVQAAALIRQIAAHPAWHGPGATGVIVAPAGLGALRFSLERGEKGLRLVIDAARPETADLMRRHVDQLLQELRAEGLGEVDVVIGSDGPGGRSSGEERPDGRSGPGAAGLVEAGEAPPETSVAGERNSDGPAREGVDDSGPAVVLAGLPGRAGHHVGLSAGPAAPGRAGGHLDMRL